MKSKIKADPKLSEAKQQFHARGRASTDDIGQALEDFINEQRKHHRACGSREVTKRRLELKPHALGGLQPMQRWRRHSL